MAQPAPRVKVRDLTHRPSKASPWLVRWTVDGREGSRSYPTKAAADDFRRSLLAAVRDGEPFDRAAKLPAPWVEPELEVGPTVAEWVARWFAREWDGSAARTRRSRSEAMERLLLLAVEEGAREAPSRPEVGAWLSQGANGRLGRIVDWESGVGVWFAKWSLPLEGLTRDLCDRLDTKLAISDAGDAMGSAVVGRYRKVIRQCLAAASEVGLLLGNPWPAVRASGRRKEKITKPVDKEALPSLPVAWASVHAMRSHQPASLTYRDMTSLVLLTGARPSEVMDLWNTDFELPRTQGGWGTMHIRHADQRAGDRYADEDDGVSGETKTGKARSVPLHPLAVQIVREALERRLEFAPATRGQHGAVNPDEGLPGGSRRIWVTSTGRPPTSSNWSRCWAGARPNDSVTIYDLRHLHATVALSAGVPPGEVANRLGHTVETLFRTYIGFLEGDRRLGNERLEAEFRVIEGWED